MRAFLDFEASSLGDDSYPIEVAWVFEDGSSESHLIRPADGWTDWNPRAEAIHHITRGTLLAEGEAHEAVAARMIKALDGHDLFASAPSWDGKWLSVLLRAAGLPRHALRLRNTEAAQRETAGALLAPHLSGEALARAVEDILVRVEVDDRHVPKHRALDDAEQERQRWLKVRDLAQHEAGNTP